MKCPNCGSEHDPMEGGRFCDACGLSVYKLTNSDDRDDNSEEQVGVPDRCPSCGTPSRPPLCPACFTRFPAAED